MNVKVGYDVHHFYIHNSLINIRYSTKSFSIFNDNFELDE
jgi:hypothetical protein